MSENRIYSVDLMKESNAFCVFLVNAESMGEAAQIALVAAGIKESFGDYLCITVRPIAPAEMAEEMTAISGRVAPGWPGEALMTHDWFPPTRGAHSP